MGGLVGVLSILSPRECGMYCHQSNPYQERYYVLRQCPAVIFWKRQGKLIHQLIAEIEVAEGCMVQWRTLHIEKISSRRRMENCTPRPRPCMEDVWLIFTSEWSVGLVTVDKIILENSGPFNWSLKAKVTSKGAKGWKFLELSPRRRRPKLCRARRIIQRTRRGMHFAVVADKMDLSSSERRLEKEKYNFYCVVNKLVYVTLTVRENCAHFHSIFDLSTFLCFKRVSEGHFLCRVITRNGNYK